MNVMFRLLKRLAKDNEGNHRKCKGIDPSDSSPQTQQGRQLNSIEQLNGMELCIKIGIEEGTNGYQIAIEWSLLLLLIKQVTLQEVLILMQHRPTLQHNLPSINLTTMFQVGRNNFN